ELLPAKAAVEFTPHHPQDTCLDLSPVTLDPIQFLKFSCVYQENPTLYGVPFEAIKLLPNHIASKWLNHPDSNHSLTLAAASSYWRFPLQPLTAGYFLLNCDCRGAGHKPGHRKRTTQIQKASAKADNKEDAFIWNPRRGLSELRMCGSNPVEVFNLSPPMQNGEDPLDQVNNSSPVFRDYFRGQVDSL
ncbi:hypothetical protein HGM15179_001939, partial [Zosterops borbonicus]